MEYFDFETAAISPDRLQNDRGTLQAQHMSSSNLDKSESRNSRLSANATEILRTWLQNHTEYPYISKDEIEVLEVSTKLSKNQIRGWLANARRRGRSRSKSINWSVGSDTVGHDIFSNNHTPQLRSSSIDSQKSAVSSDSESSWFSNLPNATSEAIGPSIHKRRRRRSRSCLGPIQKSKPNITPNDSSRIFQCTFCTGCFATKYDWQRHEKTSHLTLEKWVCCSNGPNEISNREIENSCSFCALPVSDEHINHNFEACQSKLFYDRTFYRKDHFVQHLRLSHNATYQPHMQYWKQGISDLNSRCGFCGLGLTTWNGRTDHLAIHFREGATMSQWSGGWGFDKNIEEMVLNSIQPHLIDFERRAMNPFVAPNLEDLFGLEDGLTLEQAIVGDHSYSMRGDGTWYGWLGTELGKFLEKQKMSGLVVTDEDLRCQARMLTYDDSDPWNWTLADDPIWMNNFKSQHVLNLDALSLE